MAHMTMPMVITVTVYMEATPVTPTPRLSPPY